MALLLKSNSSLPGNARQTIDGTPIHPDLAFVATAVAEFERVVLDAKSASLPKANSGLPYEVRQYVDHIHPYSKGGQTTLSNVQILCDPDNKWKRDLVA